MEKKLYLIDASAMFFRAFYAVRPLSSPEGIPTNAIYGYLQMLQKVLREENPDYVAICYDNKEPSFRKNLYSEYKANRSEMPEDLQAQMPYLMQLGDLLGVPTFQKPGFEADDLIGSLATFAASKEIKTVIVSGDKDFAQLVGDSIELFDPMKNKRFGYQQVIEKWGVRPNQFLDYLALVGDSSDNIPGARGIGPKGAEGLLQKYDSIADIYQHVEEISGALKSKLEASKDLVQLSLKLVEIVKDIEVVADLEQLKRKPILTEQLQSLLGKLGFKKFETSLLGSGESVSALQANPVNEEPRVVFNETDLVLTEVSSQKELDSLLDSYQEIWIVSEEQNLLAQGLKVFKCLFEIDFTQNKSVTYWCGFDLKKSWHRFKVENPEVRWDSLLASYVIHPKETKAFSALLGEYCDGIEPDEVDKFSETKLYSAHLYLRSLLEHKIEEIDANGILKDIEYSLSPLLFQMEKRGICIDMIALADMSSSLAQELNELEGEIRRLAGLDFNVASPKQLAEVLFEKLKLPTGKKTKTGFSTDNDVLMKLADEYPICAKVVEYREAAKLKSTYVDALPTLAVFPDNRVHTEYKQALTQTGRLSSVHPNLQNIPVRTERGRKVRSAFVSGKGLQLLSVDYSQIELRILAHFSGDVALQKAFKEDLDIHSATASEVFSIPLAQVTSEQRRQAKAVNFGIAYGQGAYGLAESLNISRIEAKEIITRYFQKFPGVQNYMVEIVESAKKKGFVETLIGRRRYLAELQSKNHVIRQFGERAAINAPIQGTASDIVKLAMISVSRHVPQLPMLLQVHDELIFEGPERVIQEFAPQIVELMEGIVTLSVPLKVNYGFGKNWLEIH